MSIATVPSRAAAGMPPRCRASQMLTTIQAPPAATIATRTKAVASGPQPHLIRPGRGPDPPRCSPNLRIHAIGPMGTRATPAAPGGTGRPRRWRVSPPARSSTHVAANTAGSSVPGATLRSAPALRRRPQRPHPARPWSRPARRWSRRSHVDGGGYPIEEQYRRETPEGSLKGPGRPTDAGRQPGARERR